MQMSHGAAGGADDHGAAAQCDRVRSCSAREPGNGCDRLGRDRGSGRERDDDKSVTGAHAGVARLTADGSGEEVRATAAGATSLHAPIV